jgi:phospho-N-acetylmuramoyl-pentapeptide-transferase
LDVAVTGSVMLQVSWFKVTVVIRFWIIAGTCVAAGLAIFYGDWLGSLNR